MNSGGLAAQARELTPGAQASLGLLLTWLLSPLLRFDETSEGRDRTADSLRLLEEAQKLEGPDVFRAAATEVAAAPELQLHEEPEGPAAYRVDFLAALLYALRAGAGDGEALRQCLTRVGDSLDFAANDGLIQLPPRLDDSVMTAITSLMGKESVAVAASPLQLRELVQDEYEVIAGGVR
jgi:hypothetical protein